MDRFSEYRIMWVLYLICQRYKLESESQLIKDMKKIRVRCI